MKNLMIPDHYEPALNLHDTQIAIKTVKDFFQNLLAERIIAEKIGTVILSVC